MKRNLKNIFIIILFLTSGFICTSQDTTELNYQRIDFCEEQDEICAFIEKFGSISDPYELRKEVIFPDFCADHICLITHMLPLPALNSNDTNKTHYSDKEIEKYLRKRNCSNTLHFYKMKAEYNIEWKDSILQNHSSIETYFFKKEENQIKYLESVISEYGLPIDFSSVNIKHALKSEISFCLNEENNQSRRIPGLRISKYGFQIIEIYKINNEYKVKRLSYFRD